LEDINKYLSPPCLTFFIWQPIEHIISLDSVARSVKMSGPKAEPSVDLKTTAPVVNEAPSGGAKSSMSNGDEELGADHSALEGYVPGTVAEKRLLRKVDLIMVPSLWFMCVMAYLDRNNIVSMRRFSRKGIILIGSLG
jgi:hypothetical protein